MAASKLSLPGSEFGACVEPCDHDGCAQDRAIAHEVCPWCDEEIGFDIDFFVDASGPEKVYTHTSCEFAAIDEGRA